MTQPVVLLFHRVAHDPIDAQSLCVSPENFALQMEELMKTRLPLPLEDFVARWADGSLPANAVAITFDDGYSDNLTEAAPILRSYGLPATFFICTGDLGSRIGFWGDHLERLILENRKLPAQVALGNRVFDLTSARKILSAHDEIRASLRPLTHNLRLQALEILCADLNSEQSDSNFRPLLTESQVGALAATSGFAIGAHTVNHPLLSQLAEAEQMQEISDSRARLRSITGAPVDTFAYPYGDKDSYDRRTESVCEVLGFTLACTTNRRAATGRINRTRIPRVVVRNWSGKRFAKWIGGTFPHEALESDLEARNQRIVDYLSTSHGYPPW